jgi:hypothetical protein
MERKPMKTQTAERIFGWWFCGATLRDGSPIPADGVWLPKIDNIELCKCGYHGSLHPFDALKYAPGEILCRCEYRGIITYDTDKFVAQERRIIQRMDASEMLRYFARMQAVSVAHLWDPPDVVLDYLMSGDHGLRAAAMDAAWAAARAAARNAAWAVARDVARAVARNAARNAARDAAWTAARAAASDAAWTAFAELVNECFGVKP